MKSHVIAGFAFAFASALLFAARPILVKLAYLENLDPTMLMLLRMSFSAPIYLATLIFFWRRRAKLTGGDNLAFSLNDFLSIAGIGLLGYYAASYLDLLGLQYITAQMGRVILYIYPTLVVIGSIFINKKLPSKATLAALALAYFGVLLIFGHDFMAFGTQTMKGSFYIFLCAACFAAYLVLSKAPISKFGSGLFTSVALLSACGGILLHFLVSTAFSMQQLTPVNDITQRAYLLCLAIAIFSTVLPTFFTAAAIARIGAIKMSVVSMVGPAVTSVLAVAVLAEAYTVYHLLGTILIILGIGILQLGSLNSAGTQKKAATNAA